MTLAVDKSPCSTCPYRRDVPSGLWHSEEYEKLRKYDDDVGGGVPSLSTFLCHQSNVTGRETACKGWLMVHRDSVAVRLAVIQGKVEFPECFEPTNVPLFGSGGEAADHGEREIENPGEKAVSAAERLLRTGRFGP